MLRPAVLRVFLLVGLALGLGLLLPNKTDAQAVSLGYRTDETLSQGMLVGLSQDGLSVMAANQDESAILYGVVVSRNSAPVSLADDQPDVFVATEGSQPTLVSDLNGYISRGDYVAISAIKGVGQKANQTSDLILGVAQEDFDPSDPNQVIGKSDIGSATASLGVIDVQVGVTNNPLRADDSSLPGFLMRAGESIANKPVSDLRIYLSLSVALVIAIVSGSMLYSAVFGSLVAVGRNPLGKRVIVRSTLKMFALSLMILFAGIVGIVVILRL